jgi:hypothetical protein
VVKVEAASKLQEVSPHLSELAHHRSEAAAKVGGCLQAIKDQSLPCKGYHISGQAAALGWRAVSKLPEVNLKVEGTFKKLEVSLNVEDTLNN